jgi:hypothetical protein
MRSGIAGEQVGHRGASLKVRRLNWLLAGAAFWLVLAAASAHAQNATINWYRVANGGGVSTGNGCTIMGTIGQAEPGLVQAGNVAVVEGFWSADAVVPPRVIYWISTAGGNWSNPANWIPNQVPGPRDEVHIILNTAVTVDMDTTAGSLVLSSGTLTGPGKLTLTGALNWTGGTITGTVQCNGGTVDHNTWLIGGQLINTGHLTVSTEQGYSFSTGDGSVISNLAGGTLDWVTDAGTTWSGSTPGTIYNAGLFRKSAGTGTTSIYDTFNNLANGTVEADSGILSLREGGLNSGTNAANAGGTLDFGGGTHTLDANSWLAGSGVISCSRETVNFSGASASTGTILIDGGTFNFNNVTPASVPAVTITSGRLGGSGALVATGPLNWTGGTITGTVQCNGGTVDHNTWLIGGQLINTGHLTVSTEQGYSFSTGDGSVISNLAGATLDWATDSGTTPSGGMNGTIYNAGLFRKTAGTGTTTIGDNFTNTATVETWSGTLQFNMACVQNAGQTRLLGGRLQAGNGFLLNGGLLEGTNTLIGNVLNKATVAPGVASSPGVLTISGNYTEAGASFLEIGIGGATPGTGFDQLSVSGTATLAGTLAVSLINGFVPPTNSTYNFLTAGSRNGTFSTTNYPSSLSSAAVSYAANGASLIVAGTPSAPPLLTIRLLGANSVSLSWPSSATGFNLEATPSLAPATWTLVGLVPADDGITKSLILPLSSSATMFYRLHLSQ